MAHCWVLRQQGPRALSVPVVLLFPVVGGGGGPGVAGCGVCWLGIVPALHRCGGRVLVPFGVRGPPNAPGCGVCGLLFENCIVDASILRTPVPFPWVAASVVGRGWCGVFVIDRRQELRERLWRWCCCLRVGVLVVRCWLWLLVGVFCDHVASF